MNKENIKQKAAQIKAQNIPAHLDPQAVLALIERLAGSSYAGRFVVRALPAEKPGIDSYRISDLQDKILIEATSGVAAAAAFNWYLRNRCDSYVGPLTRRLNFPADPPKISSMHADSSPFLYRYFLNFCTYGYTLAFWKWEQWEPFIDWMMLSGYNLVLNPIGHEVVWIRLLMEHGYTEREAKEFLCGPTFFPWQCMMNLSGWGGPAPDSWYEDHIRLAQQINAKLQSFGAGVMLPGFSGMVPNNFKEHCPASHPIGQGGWCGFLRPDLILPNDPLFDSVATAFYRIQADLFGRDFHYFSTDPFHEGGDSGSVDLTAYAQGCYDKMKTVSETPVWFLQGWQGNPKRDMLRALQPDQVLIGNLQAEKAADGGDDFAGYPWLYCHVNNFGGQRVVRGNMKKLLTEPHRYVKDNDHTMIGIGLIPEGVETDEILFDIVGDLAIHQDAYEEDAWLRGYLIQRYGSCPEAVYTAWKLLREKVYAGDTASIPQESSFCTRPSLTVNMVSSYATGVFNYQPADLAEACRLLESEYDALSDTETYRLDITDFFRQALANKGWEYIQKIQEAFAEKQIEQFNASADKFLSLYPLQEALVATSRHMLLGSWLELAKSHGRNAQEVAYYEYLARTLITLWGDRDGAKNLRDYAAREWDGMLQDFYRPRWESYITMLRVALVTGREIYEYSRYDAEYVFNTLTRTYPTRPYGDLRSALTRVMQEI